MSAQTTHRRQLPLVLALLAGCLVVMGSTHRAGAQEKKVTVEKVAYRGWKHALRLSNGKAELIVTLDVGPHYQLPALRRQKRLQELRRADGQNGRIGLADSRRPSPLDRAGGPDTNVCPG